MDSNERLFFLATLESMEASFNANIRALRALIAHTQNQQYSALKKEKIITEDLEKIEEEFAKSIFTLEGIESE